MEPIVSTDGSACWSYKGSDNIWKAYDSATNAQIEYGYDNELEEIALNKGVFFGLENMKNVYIVRFDCNNTHKSFIQLNTKTNYMRQINRNDGKKNMNTKLSKEEMKEVYPSNDDGSACWSYKDYNEWKKYDDATNKQIETAYSSNKKEIILNKGPFFGVLKNANIYKIQFNSINEFKTLVQLNTKSGYIRGVNRNKNGQNLNKTENIIADIEDEVKKQEKEVKNGMIRWLYNDDWEWKEYDQASSDQIETSFLDELCSKVLLDKGPFFGAPNRKRLYCIIFKRDEFPIICTQLNTQTNFVRQCIRAKKKKNHDDDDDNDDNKQQQLYLNLGEMNKKNEKLTEKNNALMDKVQSLENDKKTLIKENEGNKKEIVKLESENNELSKNMERIQDEQKEMEIDFIKIKEELQRLKLKSLDENNYKSWNGEELVAWIINFDQENYKKYKNILLKNFVNEDVDGSCLEDIDANDIKSWGITNFKHRKAIFNKIQQLLLQKSTNVAIANTNNTVAPPAFSKLNEGTSTAYI